MNLPGTTPKSSRTRTRSATERDICASGALGDRQACLLERWHVVDPVADHRDVASGVGERGHDRRLPLFREIRPTAVARTASRSAAGSVGSASPSSAGAEPGAGRRGRSRRPVAGASPESTFNSIAWALKKATVSLSRSRRGALSPSACTSSGSAVVAGGGAAAAQREHARPAPCARVPRGLGRRARSARGLPARVVRRRGPARSSGAGRRTAPVPHHAAPLDISEVGVRDRLERGARSRRSSSARARPTFGPRRCGTTSARSRCRSCPCRRCRPRRATRSR